jgi:hypothetical protein
MVWPTLFPRGTAGKVPMQSLKVKKQKKKSRGK